MGRLARLRGSFLGRNLKGVWKTLGADDGGLKMMWLPDPVAGVGVLMLLPLPLLVLPDDGRKEGCGGMLSARFVREAVDFWRVPRSPEALRCRHPVLDDGAKLEEEEARRRLCRQQLAAGLRRSCTSIAFFFGSGAEGRRRVPSARQQELGMLKPSRSEEQKDAPLKEST